MFVNLRRLIRVAITDYEKKIREQWVLDHSSQVVLMIHIAWLEQLVLDHSSQLVLMIHIA